MMCQLVARYFYPRSPCGERPARNTSMAGRITSFLSTLSLRRATLGAWKSCDVRGISIHALLAESDRNVIDSNCDFFHFYPRSPCGERLGCWMALNRLLRFLSTLSLRRATTDMRQRLIEFGISIHALLAESDLAAYPSVGSAFHFYPRSPCGERPPGESDQRHWLDISIHALLAESDLEIHQSRAVSRQFLSTLSLRRATTIMLYDTSSLIFLSTLSLRRATTWQKTNPNPKIFLSTLSLRRATQQCAI